VFVRFVVGADDEDHRLLNGLVSEARFLRDRNELTAAEEELLEATYAWLNTNLPCPPFAGSGWSKNAVAWFKDGAIESIQQMRILAALLTQHERPVRMLRSRNPGKVLYEDRFQVVVEEWKRL
jgi:hypothetical protein